MKACAILLVCVSSGFLFAHAKAKSEGRGPASSAERAIPMELMDRIGEYEVVEKTALSNEELLRYRRHGFPDPETKRGCDALQKNRPGGMTFEWQRGACFKILAKTFTIRLEPFYRDPGEPWGPETPEVVMSSSCAPRLLLRYDSQEKRIFGLISVPAESSYFEKVGLEFRGQSLSVRTEYRDPHTGSYYSDCLNSTGLRKTPERPRPGGL